MKKIVLTLPTFGLAVATRAALGAGVALLASDRMSSERRRAVGLVLVGIGAVTTVPLVRAVLRSTNDAPSGALA